MDACVFAAPLMYRSVVKRKMPVGCAQKKRGETQVHKILLRRKNLLRGAAPQLCCTNNAQNPALEKMK